MISYQENGPLKMIQHSLLKKNARRNPPFRALHVASPGTLRGR